MFVAWRDLRFARGRFALMGGVVVMMTVLVGLLSGLTSGLSRESTSAVTGLAVDRLVFSSSGKPSFTTSSVTPADWRRWATVPGVRAAEPLGVSPARASGPSGPASVTVFGVAPASALNDAAAAVRPGSVVLSAGAAETLGARAGDRITLAGTALAVAAVRGDASFSHTPVVWTPLDAWQRLTPGNPTGTTTGPTATVVALRTGAGFDAAAGPGTSRTIDESLSAIGAYSSENGSLQLIRAFLFAISAVVTGAFFTVWTIQRGGDVAVLKALGASDGYLLRDALGQALVLLVGGTAVGAMLAAGAGLFASGTVPFVLDARTLGLPLVAMVALGMLGAAASVRRITAVDPLVALGSVR